MWRRDRSQEPNQLTALWERRGNKESDEEDPKMADSLVQDIGTEKEKLGETVADRVQMAVENTNRRSAGWLDLLNFPQCNGETDAEYLTRVSGLVSKNRHNTVPLMNPAGATWTIGNLDDTIYSGEDNEVNGWNNFYLPTPVNMQVIGVVEGTSCPCEQLVLMTCEDRRVYAYDGEGEELHLVASSLNRLFHMGIEYPASKTYYDGEAFKDMTEEDWAEVRKSDVGKQLDEEHHKLVISENSRFLDNIKFSILA